MKDRPLLPVAVIAAVSVAGLVFGLTGDGLEDLAANLALALCLVPIAGALCRR